MTGSISSIPNAQLRAKLREMDNLLRRLQTQVKSITGGVDGEALAGIPYLGEFSGSSKADLPSPTEAPKVAKLNQQGSGYGDEYWISGRKGDGSIDWSRISGFSDS